jgi:hypothetical protein
MVSTGVAYGAMLAVAGLVLVVSLVLFMVVLRDDGPQPGDDRPLAPVAWPIATSAPVPASDEGALQPDGELSGFTKSGA